MDTHTKQIKTKQRKIIMHCCWKQCLDVAAACSTNYDHLVVFVVVIAWMGKRERKRCLYRCKKLEANFSSRCIIWCGEFRCFRERKRRAVIYLKKSQTTGRAQAADVWVCIILEVADLVTHVGRYGSWDDVDVSGMAHRKGNHICRPPFWTRCRMGLKCREGWCN